MQLVKRSLKKKFPGNVQKHTQKALFDPNKRVGEKDLQSSGAVDGSDEIRWRNRKLLNGNNRNNWELTS